MLKEFEYGEVLMIMYMRVLRCRLTCIVHVQLLCEGCSNESVWYCKTFSTLSLLSQPTHLCNCVLSRNKGYLQYDELRKTKAISAQRWHNNTSKQGRKTSALLQDLRANSGPCISSQTLLITLHDFVCGTKMSFQLF